jgi:cytochrome c peroxidase
MLSATLLLAVATPGKRDDQRASAPAPARNGRVTPAARPLSHAAPEVLLGNRLFFETRFAQFFFQRCNGDVNKDLTAGDTVVNEVEGAMGTGRESPFRGQSINCRQCHLGDDLIAEEPLAGRTYCDFSRRSLIPARDDGLTRTPRNSPLMINLGLAREVPMLLHFDGEFATHEDLVVATLTGRNFGWLPTEAPVAARHVARVVREDEGIDPKDIVHPVRGGIPYRTVMRGTDPDLPPSLRIPPEYRIDVATASDEQVVYAVAKLMHAYMDSLRFGTTNTGRDTDSPYDLFLQKNRMPEQPEGNESDLAYTQRLLSYIEQHEQFEWVSDDDVEFELHQQSFQFGPTELQGLKIFFRNCVACHTPPQFTDYHLHNTGVSQVEYDAIFGAGAFAALEIPGLAARNAEFDAYLPASFEHPKASGRFRSPASADKPGWVDLGVWNVWANPDMPKPQAALRRTLCDLGRPTPKDCTPAAVLPLTIAHFKTPSIRDLGQSFPYLHSGSKDTIEDVIRFYLATSELARQGKLRNGSPEVAAIRLATGDVAPLAAFLRALNEDYH